MPTSEDEDQTIPDEPHTTSARLAAGAALRQLGNALVAHQVDDALLARVAAEAQALAAMVAEAPPRSHAFLHNGVNIFESAVPDGNADGPRSSFPDCVISGMANPMGVAARLWREEDEAVCQVTLGAAFEGAPGRAHGGIVAALIDETMGLVMSMSRTPAFTGRLTVTYRAPTPVGEPLEVRARLAARVGRKMTMTAELRNEERLLAEAEGLFIVVDPDKFFVAQP